MTILEDWPSLPPIRTSSVRDSRVSCETLSLHDPSVCSPSTDNPLPNRKFDSFFPVPASADASPPGSDTERGHHFSCFPNKSASHAIAKAMMSPSKEGRKGPSDVGTVLRSCVGFSGPIRHSGPLVQSRALALSNKAGSMPISGHAGSLKGYTVNSKGHAANVFTMMPPDVVGKKKPPGYESDEPTSPEVTCIGRVRRKKHCKAWDALIKENKAEGKYGKGKKPGFESPRKLKLVGFSPTASPVRPLPSRGKQSLIQTKGADLPRQSNMDNPSSELDRVRSGTKFSAEAIYSDLGLSARLPSENGDSETADEGTGFPYQPPPQNCLLQMKKTTYSRGHYAHGDILGVATEWFHSMEKDDESKTSKNASLWKRRMGRPQSLKLEVK